MDSLLENVLRQFRLDCDAISYERYGCGHINETYLVVTGSGHRYILQKINNRAFPNVAELQENIEAVTAHLHKKINNPNGALTLIRTHEDKTWYHYGENSDWRIYDYIENSICLQAPKSAEDFYQSAIAFGSFQQQLADFPADTLHETIPNFHNTPDRYRIFKDVLAKDSMNRAVNVQSEISFALAHEKVGGRLTDMLKSGILPLRVTHNDTKLNNVMLDAATRTPLCVIDLDTTMPGLCAYDFGDSIRFGASTAAEDEKDLEKVTMSLDLFRIFTKGYLKACPGLTKNERQALALGAMTMTLECGLRFLTDYLDGDRYFGIHYPENNLDRCRTQFKLVSDMEDKWTQMNQIVQEESEIVDGTVL